MPGIMDIDIGDSILTTLRRISHSVDLYSRVLHREYGLTGPQLTILTALYRTGPLTVSGLARRVSLSQATVTNILDRLEQQSFVNRIRGTSDKRMVYVEITDKTREILDKRPNPLNTEFLERINTLPDWEQTLLLSSLQRIASLMEQSGIPKES